MAEISQRDIRAAGRLDPDIDFDAMMMAMGHERGDSGS
jgi:hypothetical protein